MRGLILPYQDLVPRIDPSAFVAPDATIVGDVEIGEDSNVWYKCMFRGDVAEVRVGRRCNLQDGTVIHVTGGKYGTIVGDDVSVGHLVLLHGCTLESGSFVGMRATVMDGCVVETGAMVAAGSLLTPGKRVPRGELWSGSPARFMRAITDKDLAHFRYVSEHYVQLGRRHRAPIEAAARAAG